jgi:hypothetical protein
LPANLGALARLADKGAGRYSSAVQLTATAGGYKAVATNGKILGVVTGLSDDSDKYPDLPALASAPNGETCSLVPVKDWAAAFKAAPKPRPSYRRQRVGSVLCNVAAVIGKDVTTLASTDLERVNVAQPRNVDGLFPDANAVLPKAKDKPKATVLVSAKLLIDLLTAVMAFSGEDRCAVRLDVFAPERPVRVTAGSESQQFTGLIMPLA